MVTDGEYRNKRPGTQAAPCHATIGPDYNRSRGTNLGCRNWSDSAITSPTS